MATQAEIAQGAQCLCLPPGLEQAAITYLLSRSNSFLVLNNLKYTSVSTFVPSNGSPANIGIGGRISGFLPVMDGVFDNFALWRGTVLSDATMSSLYNSGAGVDYPFQ